MKQFLKERSSGEHEVTRLNKDMAEIIIEHNIKNSKDENWNLPCLHFRKLKYLSPDAAQVLAGYSWKISISWKVFQKNSKALREVLKREVDTDFIDVGALTPEMLVAFRDAQGPISLYNVRDIQVEAAKKLVDLKKDIPIHVDKWPLEKVMSILVNKAGWVVASMKR